MIPDADNDHRRLAREPKPIPSNHPCLICHNSDNNRIYIATERRFGMGGRFEYLECDDCKTVALVTIPKDISQYYPDEYYSFQQIEIEAINRFIDFVKSRRTNHYLGRVSIIGWLASIVSIRSEFFNWFVGMDLRADSTILDVGAGSGQLLVHLRNEGFTRVEGIDPLLPDDISYDNGVRVRRLRLDQVRREYDIVMMHHSLEHMHDPHEAFRNATRLMKHKGYFLIRIPLAGSHAWKTYRTRWVQLDAPRHIMLLTPAAIELLAGQYGCRVIRTIFDSTDFQFWGSEQYCRDICHEAENSHYKNPSKSIFAPLDIEHYRQEAKRLNESGEGDSACFILQKEF